MVIIRLHNLAVRVPTLADAHTVAELMIACDSAEAGVASSTAEAVLTGWQTTGFNLQTDAWIIVTREGEGGAYADVQYRNNGDTGEFVTLLRVHPRYRGRGVETFLLRLVEMRARQRMHALPCAQPVCISATLSSLDQQAREVFEQEGYELVRRFWRLGVAIEEDGPVETIQPNVELVIDAHSLLDTAPAQRRTGMYTARQYEVYTKALRLINETDMAVNLSCTSSS